MEALRKIIKDMLSRLDKIENGLNIKILTLRDGTFVVPETTSDPSSPVDGQIWFRTDTNQLKIRNGGTTKSVTLT